MHIQVTIADHLPILELLKIRLDASNCKRAIFCLRRSRSPGSVRTYQTTKNVFHGASPIADPNLTKPIGIINCSSANREVTII